MEAKEFKDDTGNVLYLTVSLHEIKETDIVAHASRANAKDSYAPSTSQEIDVVAYTRNPQSGEPSYAPSASDLKTADIFKNVNPDDGRLLKYILDEFLNEEQLLSKSAEIEKTKAYIEKRMKNMTPTEMSKNVANGVLPHPERRTVARIRGGKSKVKRGLILPRAV